MARSQARSQASTLDGLLVRLGIQENVVPHGLELSSLVHLRLVGMVLANTSQNGGGT